MCESNIILLIKQLNISLDLYGREEMKHEDITPSQSFLLNYLLSRKIRELYATDIHGELGFSKATISSLLKALKQKGYLILEADPEDDRRKRIVLTEKAYKMEKRIEKAVKGQQLSLCREIPGRDLKTLELCLRQMLSNIRPEMQGGMKHDKNAG